MIEKLDTKMEFVEISVLGNKKAECLDFEAGRKLNLKINELVDAVNTIQKEREAERFEIQEWIGILEAVRKSVNIHEKQIDELQMKLEPEKCEPADTYAEQKKWIGKLCRFWDDDAFITSNDWAYGMLTSIDKGMQYQYCCNEISNFKHCEPVKPDDDVIYQELTPEYLRNLIATPKYWKEQDPETIRRVEEGFKKLYGDKGE